MSNILFLTHIYPYPPNDGGRIVTYNTLKVLEKNGHKINLISFIDPNKEEKYEFPNTEQHLVSKSYQNSKLALLLNLIEKMPFTMKKYKDSKIEEKIKNILISKNVDFIILDHLHMAYYVEIIKKVKPDIPVYLRQHNIESMIMERAYEKEKNIFKKFYLKVQYKKLKKYEAEVCEKMDHIFVITDEDKKALGDLNSKVNKNEITVVKAGVDIVNYKPLQIERDKNNIKNIVFLGAMNWLPNENGILWFVDEVMPELMDKINDLKLYIVGKNPTEKIRNLKSRYPNNIIVTGFVEDDKEYIARADVFIVPLFIGGGMRLKILNALAMKKAIVTTKIGAEGINLENSYIIADTANEFITSIKLILEQDEYRESLESNGYNQVRKNYSFEAVLEPLLNKVKM